MDNNRGINNNMLDEILDSMNETQNEEQQDTADTNTENIQQTEENRTSLEEVNINNLVLNMSEGSVTTRFNSAPWIDVNTESATIIGCGGIGSWTALMLGRLNMNITLFDADTVSRENIGSQLFRKNEIGLSKTLCVNQMLYDYCNVWCSYHSRHWDNNCMLSTNVFCCVDNMDTRSKAFHEWYADRNRQNNRGIFIDGRLAAECFQIFCIDSEDEFAIKEYQEKYLFSDNEADETICSYKQTTFAAAMIGSVITNLFLNYFTNKHNDCIIRPVPFKTEYDAATMHFKTSD